MRIAIASLVLLYPVLAFSSSDIPKDKYLNCNCHITPEVTGNHVTPVAAKKPVHHHHKAVKKADVTPPVAKHKRKALAQKAAPKTYAAEGYPGRDAIIPSNKLALPTGKSIYSSGELVYISGRVLDMKCVPVSDAIVEIWQTDPEGHYVHASLADRLSPAPTFAGSGRATTDNLGRFNFVTVFPGPIGGRAPFIHVHVIHKDFPILDTQMFFANDSRNTSDPVFSALAPDDRTKLTAKVWQRDTTDPAKGLAASWDISLNGKNPYRHF